MTFGASSIVVFIDLKNRHSTTNVNKMQEKSLEIGDKNKTGKFTIELPPIQGQNKGNIISEFFFSFHFIANFRYIRLCAVYLYILHALYCGRNKPIIYSSIISVFRKSEFHACASKYLIILLCNLPSRLKWNDGFFFFVFCNSQFTWFSVFKSKHLWYNRAKRL